MKKTEITLFVWEKPGAETARFLEKLKAFAPENWIGGDPGKIGGMLPEGSQANLSLTYFNPGADAEDTSSELEQQSRQVILEELKMLEERLHVTSTSMAEQSDILRQTQARLREANSQQQELEAKIKMLKQRHKDVMSSASMRITAPIRVVASRLRGWRGRAS